MKLTKNEGGEIDLPASIDWIVEEDPVNQTKLTNPNTGQVYNIVESIPRVRALIAEEKGR